jgi:hypothetical protein
VLTFAAMNAFWEARLGALIAGGGMIWAARVATLHAQLSGFIAVGALSQILNQTGPMEICAVGILLWLHAKWRGSIRAH